MRLTCKKMQASIKFMFEDYLKQIGLENLLEEIEKTKLNDFVSEAFSKNKSGFTENEISDLYTYKVPKLTPDGSCSIVDELSPLPYNLSEIYKLPFEVQTLENHKQTIYLWKLKYIIEKLQAKTGVDWLGIYKKIKNAKRNLVLVKESYYGVPSRAEFPLTKKFAKKSNNSTVGLTGKSVLINDVRKHTGAYYNCDTKVNSEFCIPIINKKNEVVGIIDAEAFPANFYNNERLLQIAKVTYDLKDHMSS